MSSSVFVRNLPYGITQEELEQVFSDIGPVKKVDVIKDKGKKKSDMLTRGFAFVKFAIENDAVYAVEKLNGHELQGRRMRLEIAREKGKRHENASAQPRQPQQQQKEEEATPVAKTEAEEYIPLENEDVKPKKEKKEKKFKKEVAEVKEEESVKAEDKASKKDKKEKKKKDKRVKQEAEPESVEEVKQEESKKKAAPASTQKTPAAVADKPNFAAATPKVNEDGHVQSERNARRRMHREFLRQLQQRKNDDASVEQKSIVIYGLGAEVTQKHIAKKVKKIGMAVKIELKEEDKTQKKFAVVQFEKLANVDTAIKKLDRHIFKGAMLKVKCLASGANDAKENEGLRLIVRNLAFQTTDSDLEKAFEVHGPLFEARVVRMPVEDLDNAAPDAVGRSRGFGFVQFRDINDARQAIEKLNGVKIKGREMIVDFALAKSKYLEQQKAQQDMQVKPDDDDDDEDVDGEGHDNELEMESGDEGSDDGEGTDDDEGEEDDEDDDSDDEEKPSRPKMDTEEQRYRTIFIRNLSFQTTEDGLKAFFSTFGAVEYARIVYDYGSGLSKGVAFVRFKDSTVADRVLARGQLAADREDQKKNKKGKAKKENLFTLSALADGDALMLDGRMLSLTRAVGKEDADRLTTENSNERKKKDKRNMYLAYEGTINVNKLSDEELMLPKMDIDKRRRAIREKKEKLKNPMYFVSPVRLSVRNISSSVDDKKLKEIFRDGAIAGLREKNVDRSEVKLELLPKNDAVPVKVKMAKIVRDTETAKAGKEARSRGYGFVEFAEHTHALAALRKINNNPAFTHYAAGAKTDKKGGALEESEKSRLIVEFALENHGKLKLREKRKQDAEKRREEEKALREAQGEGAETTVVEKKSRGQRQREAKKARALEKSEKAVEGADGAKAVKKPKKEVIVPSKAPSQKRKRTDVDEVASSLPSGSMTKAEKKNKKVKTESRRDRKQAKEIEQEESFDALVRNYKREIFGEKPVAARNDDAQEQPRERWFD